MSGSELGRRRAQFRMTWNTLGLYERFEQLVTLVLTALIALIVLIAAFDLAKHVILLIWFGLFDPLDHRSFQAFFGQIMTLLIALEFKHSITRVAAHRQGIIQVKTVILIALLAISRKFIILDIDKYSAATVSALAAVVLALGGAYWLVRNREARPAATTKKMTRGAEE